jgi:hypothetical protein
MTARSLRPGLLWISLIAIGALAAAADRLPSIVAPTGWRQHDIHRPRPSVIEPSPDLITAPAPKDALVLFDGRNLDAWQTPEGSAAMWALKPGYFEVKPGAGPIQSKAKFGDVQLHVEWAAPDPPRGVGQDRGNSGIFLMGQFELQVLDSYKADTYADGQAGAIYGQYPPLFNATRPPGQWQSYEVAFRRPKFDASGKLTSPARMTVFLNGVLVQDNEEMWGQTSWLEPLPYDPSVNRGPIELQDHGHPVRFRNIWVRELPERALPTVQQARQQEIARLSSEQLDALVGRYEAGPGANDFHFSIAHEDDHLIVTLPFRPTPLRLLPVSDTVFILPHTDGRVAFAKDAQGRATDCEFQVGDGKKELTRAIR